MKRQRVKREWHVAQTGVWWVYDPEQRTHGGPFADADAARAYMAGLTGRPVEHWTAEAGEVEAML